MTLLTVVILLAVVATVGALAGGIASMAHGGEYDRRHGGRFMAARVGLQGLALVLALIALLVAALR